MSASVALDFHYLLLMPEPERYFTVSLAAQQLGISQQEAEQILRNSTPGGCGRVE